MPQPTSTRPQLVSQKGRSGQAIVLIAVFMSTLIIMLGLAIDGGGLYLLNRDAQNAVDAAVLAATYSYCVSTDESPADGVPDTDAWKSTAISIAEQNGFVAPETPGPNDPILEVGVLGGGETEFGLRNSANPYFVGMSASDRNQHVEVYIRAEKPSYFIQLIYPGDLVIESSAIGRCTTNQVSAGAGGGGGGGAAPLLDYPVATLCDQGECTSDNGMTFPGSGHVFMGDLYACSGTSSTEGQNGQNSFRGNVELGDEPPNPEYWPERNEDGTLKVGAGADIEFPASRPGGYPLSMDNFRPAGASTCDGTCGLVESWAAGDGAVEYYDMTNVYFNQNGDFSQTSQNRGPGDICSGTLAGANEGARILDNLHRVAFGAPDNSNRIVSDQNYSEVPEGIYYFGPNCNEVTWQNKDLPDSMTIITEGKLRLERDDIYSPIVVNDGSNDRVLPVAVSNWRGANAGCTTSQSDSAIQSQIDNQEVRGHLVAYRGQIFMPANGTTYCGVYGYSLQFSGGSQNIYDTDADNNCVSAPAGGGAPVTVDSVIIVR